MSDITKKAVKRLLVLMCAVQVVLGYENVYDMMERKRFQNEPSRNRYLETSEQYRYNTASRRPSIFASIRPSEFDRDRTLPIERRISTFGNGYDNLGNGVGASLSDRSRGDSRRFDIFRERDNDRFDSFRDIDRFDSFRDSERGRDPFYDRSYSDARPYRRVYSKRYDSEYPEFYNRDYFSRPKIEERSIDSERKNIGNAYDSTEGQKGLTGLSKIDSLVSTNEDKKQKKTDAGFKNNNEGSHVDVTNKDNFGESARVDKTGENKSTVRSNRVLKKGHTTKGFASHHHKDETGNTTTFFDESTDTGGQTDYKDIADEYGTRKTSEQFSGKEDGKYLKENGGQSGNFGSGYLHDNSKYEKDILSNDNHFDKEERFRQGGENADLDIRRNLHHMKGGHYGLSDPGMHYERFY